eukprot:m.341659 g.341659  ORF g.341659 m.341659 type:complete len:68 (+) comp20330_c0_seq1:563-766(+)
MNGTEPFGVLGFIAGQSSNSTISSCTSKQQYRAIIRRLSALARNGKYTSVKTCFAAVVDMVQIEDIL